MFRDEIKIIIINPVHHLPNAYSDSKKNYTEKTSIQANTLIEI